MDALKSGIFMFAFGKAIEALDANGIIFEFVDVFPFWFVFETKIWLLGNGIGEPLFSNAKPLFFK